MKPRVHYTKANWDYKDDDFCVRAVCGRYLCSYINTPIMVRRKKQVTCKDCLRKMEAAK